jgi:hypothetical protein
MPDGSIGNIERNGGLLCMKAIFEIELPKSCIECPLKITERNEGNNTHYLICFLLDFKMDIPVPTNSRYHECPLVVKGVCDTCNKRNDCDSANDDVVECECWETN